MHARENKFCGNGFTLLEVIIAIALTGILVSLSAGVVANVAGIWEKSDGVATLDRHVAGLDRFLSYLAEEQETTKIGADENNVDVVGATWGVPSGMDGGNYFPHFELKENYPILQIGEFPAPQLSAWIFWDADGLWLITQSPRQKNENENLTTRVLLSDRFAGAEILVRDAGTDSWELRDSVSGEDVSRPGIRLRLKFRDGRRERAFTLTLSKIAPEGIVY